MSHHERLSQWMTTVSTHFPHLNAGLVTVLTWWSFGMVMTQSCGTTTVAVFLAAVLDENVDTVRQRLREGYFAAHHKRGKNRTELDVTTCFAPFVRWILSWWDPAEQRLALAMDASTLGQRFTVLCLSIVYRGCALPVAWVVLPACRKGTWKPHWKALIEAIAPAIPPTWTVIVLADRGL